MNTSMTALLRCSSFGGQTNFGMRSKNIMMAFEDVTDIGYLCFYDVLPERFRDLRGNRFQFRSEKPKFRAIPLQFRLISGCFAPRRSML